MQLTAFVTVKLSYSRRHANPFDCSWNPPLHPHTNPPSIRSVQIWWQGLSELQCPEQHIHRPAL